MHWVQRTPGKVELGEDLAMVVREAEEASKALTPSQIRMRRMASATVGVIAAIVAAKTFSDLPAVTTGAFSLAALLGPYAVTVNGEAHREAERAAAAEWLTEYHIREGYAKAMCAEHPGCEYRQIIEHGLFYPHP